MRIAVLSAGVGWHVKDLQRAAAALDHEAVAVDFRRIQAGVGIGVDSLGNFDAVMVRTMPPGSLEQVVFRMDALHRIQARGVVVLNSPAAIEACVDKYLASAKVQAAGLRVPPTIACQHADAGMGAFVRLGGDVVVKPLFGSEGRGMVRITDGETAWRVFRTLERLQTVLYVQQFIRHPGWDLRVFVIGSKVVAAMRRYARDDWRTNVAQGGKAEAVDVTSNQRLLALKAMQAVHAHVAGVDLMQGSDGEWYVLEVNAVPGWRALAPATGIDIATAMVRFLAEEYRPC
jgi:ribosomal protein S6--L-glutamate ligase